MKYTYYRIRNIINNQAYIGITIQPNRRQRTHFNKLANNSHANPHLQLAYNKYGFKNFIFEIIEEREYNNPIEAYQHEADLIKQYDTFNNGYNCNPGGTWTGKTGKFSKQDVFYLNSAVYFNKNMRTVLANMYNCPRGTIYSATSGRTYTPWYKEFLELDEQAKRDIYEEFCDNTNFKILKGQSYSKQNKRKYTKEQVFLILYWNETKEFPFSKLAEVLNFKGKNHFENIRSGKNYKEYYNEYKTLSQKEKQQIKSAFIK